MLHRSTRAFALRKLSAHPGESAPVSMGAVRYAAAFPDEFNSTKPGYEAVQEATAGDPLRYALAAQLRDANQRAAAHLQNMSPPKMPNGTDLGLGGASGAMLGAALGSRFRGTLGGVALGAGVGALGGVGAVAASYGAQRALASGSTRRLQQGLDRGVQNISANPTIPGGVDPSRLDSTQSLADEDIRAINASHRMATGLRSATGAATMSALASGAINMALAPSGERLARLGAASPYIAGAAALGGALSGVMGSRGLLDRDQWAKTYGQRADLAKGRFDSVRQQLDAARQAQAVDPQAAYL